VQKEKISKKNILMLTRAAKYAVRASLYLAINSSINKKVGAKKIAEVLDMPLPFLAKQLQQLSRMKLISSTKGPSGGFFLNDKNREKSLWDVIVGIDGEEWYNECFLGKEECNKSSPCSIHPLVESFRKKMRKEFQEKSMGEIADNLNEGEFVNI
tara:strand:+ start:569 stop:1033 length:465 start_codon:yes stop_codon:yes gene_type:complete